MRMEVNLRVHPAVREFIVCTTGTDLIVPRKNDWLWLLLKQNLETVPIDYKPWKEPVSETIRISLLDASGSKVMVRKPSAKPGKSASDIYLNTSFRCYLDQSGQNVIARHLRSQFKQCFLNFFHGAITTNPQMEQRAILERFCQTYRLSMTSITEDMLIKTWQRSTQKSYSHTKNAGCPVVF